MEVILTTQRLRLAPFQAEETDLFHAINTEPFVRKYLWDNAEIDRETAAEVIAKNREHFTTDGYGLWKIYRPDSNEVIGYAGLWYFFDEPQPQLIYALREAYAGQGYATEAARAVVQYAFSELGFDYLLAATDEPHTASQQVAERLGMTFSEKRVEDEKVTVFFRLNRDHA
ncbi:MAG: GNAT family N-acetyltransferase [Leptolyngbya sp. SIO3F4]|nr:GNAT family N-acetyltransferase [Leptolyngbya sp. SIO3F4]